LLLPQIFPIIPDILGRRALSSGRLAGLGATLDFHHGLVRPHDWSPSTDCPRRSAVAGADSRAPSDPRTRCARSGSRTTLKRDAAARRRASRGAPPTADPPRSAPESIAPGRCVVHSRWRCSGVRHAARPESPGDRSLPRPSSRPEIPIIREPTYNRVAISPVLPCCVHINQERTPSNGNQVTSRQSGARGV
jgi:hypothetical protein